GGVFDLDALVGEAGGGGGDRGDVTGEIDELVDEVDGLVHEGAAPVECPGAAPGSGVVVGLVAIPFDVGVAHGEAAKSPLVGGFLANVHGGVKTTVEESGEGGPGRGTGVDHHVGALGSDLEGFFPDDVFARFGGGEGRFEVGAAGRGDRHDVELGITEEGV